MTERVALSTERLQLEPFAPDHAEAVYGAVMESRRALLRWMPWARDPSREGNRRAAQDAEPLHLIRGGDDGAARWLRLSLEKCQTLLGETGAVTAREIQEALQLLEDPAFATISPVTIAAWGRRSVNLS